MSVNRIKYYLAPLGVYVPVAARVRSEDGHTQPPDAPNCRCAYFPVERRERPVLARVCRVCWEVGRFAVLFCGGLAVIWLAAYVAGWGWRVGLG